MIGASVTAYIPAAAPGTSSNKVGDVTVSASDTALIYATIGAVAASVAFGGSNGVGVALGVAVASSSTTAAAARAVQAYVSGTGITRRALSG